MAKVLLLQFDTDPQRANRRNALSRLDAQIAEAEPRWPSFFDAVSAQRPDVIVIACGRLTAYAREAARYLGEGFNTRDIGLVLVGIPEKERAAFEDYVRTYQPNATFVDDTRLADTVAARLVRAGTP